MTVMTVTHLNHRSRSSEPLHKAAALSETTIINKRVKGSGESTN